ncbi:ribosome maturation factor RimM [Thermopolyspora sp. NPDC052614]|uniref:ribosome maturation factor RimM n=1 Tax=Thermopolyspora sp. NPDC052614 TaxID=3155682 RepID=UPI003435CA17
MQLVVGRIGRPHGVRGEVTVEVRTDDPELRFAPGTALRTDPESAGPLVVSSMRWHSGVLLLRLEGVGDRSAAEELRDTLIVIDSADVAPPEDPDEFYDHQLIGLSVATTGGEPVGEVSDVLHHGQDLLVVRHEGREVLIPFVKALVPEVDLKAGRLVVDPPPGLLNPDEAV